MSSSPTEPEKRAGWKKPFALTFGFLVTGVGLVSGIAQLGVLPTAVARILLIVIGLSTLLYLVVQVWQAYYVVKVRELRGRLAEMAQQLTLAQSGHQRYLDAIERISDREKPLFTETLEVTVWIGADDESDRIVERRVTTPRPLVTNRAMRPIVQTDHDQVVRLDDINFSAVRSDGAITAMPLREHINRLRVWLVFDPPIAAPCRWQVEYHPTGLWRPLRKEGWDRLGWDDRLMSAPGTPSAFTSFTAVFMFPLTDQPPSVNESHGHGTITGPERVDGMWKVTWTDPDPAGRRYDWELTKPTDGPVGPG